jgi:glycosyltransferase involved in cell wall biosynthesis
MEERSIVYFAVLLDGPKSGAGKKVIDQAETWREMSFKTTIYVVSSQPNFTEWRKVPETVVFMEAKGIKKLILRRSIMQKISRLEPDVLYVRDSFPFIFPRIAKGISTVIEVQTLMRQELFARNWFRGAQSVLLDWFYLRSISKFIFVSNEISDSNRFKKYLSSRSSIVISNGIKLDSYPENKTPAVTPPIELLFLGQNGQKWHGVEQILQLAKVMPEFVFNIVGVTDLFVNVPSNVIFHGVLKYSEYLPIAERCVAGIGTLNLSAKGMEEGSSLKVREYLAMGLPVFLRHQDTDFMRPPDFILEIPNDGNPITDYKNQIVCFSESWVNRRVNRREISKIDMKVKETERLKFIFADS